MYTVTNTWKEISIRLAVPAQKEISFWGKITYWILNTKKASQWGMHGYCNGENVFASVA